MGLGRRELEERWRRYRIRIKVKRFENFLIGEFREGFSRREKKEEMIWLFLMDFKEDG